MAERLAAASGSFLATRAEPPQRAALVARFPRAEVNELGRTVYLPPEPEPAPTGRGTILVVTAGTSGLPLAPKAGPAPRGPPNPGGRPTGRRGARGPPVVGDRPSGWPRAGGLLVVPRGG